MSPTPTRRSGSLKPTGKNIKKGVCQNHQYYNPDTGETGDCPKCASQEVQLVNVQRLSDFKCDVCGEKLVPVAGGNGKGKLIAIIAGVAIVVFLLLAFLLGLFTPNQEEVVDVVEPVENQVTDSIPAAVVDTVPAVVAEPETATEPEAVTKPEPKEEPKATTPNPTKTVLGGAATLIERDGYKTLKFNRSYTLDLGKSDGSVLHISAGDVIERAQIHNNILRSGNYRAANGTEEFIKGLNVKL